MPHAQKEAGDVTVNTQILTCHIFCRIYLKPWLLHVYDHKTEKRRVRSVFIVTPVLGTICMVT